MSRTFSMSWGSCESEKLLLRWGCRPKARQMRLMLDWLIPSRWASARVLQWVAF